MDYSSLSNELILLINQYLYEIELIALALLFYVTIKKNQINSSIVAVVVSLLVGLYSLVISPKLLEWAKQSPDFKHEIRFIWYMGFIHVDLAAIYVIRKMNKLLKIKPGDICKILLLMFISRITAHSARYIERVTLDTHYLEFFYKTFMTAINTTSTITTLILAFIFFLLQITPKVTRIKIQRFANQKLSFFPFGILINKKWSI